MSDNTNVSIKTIKYKHLFLLSIGICPTLLLTTSLKNSLILGLIICITIFASNILTNAISKFIPKGIKNLVNIIIITFVVSLVSMVLEAYFLNIYHAFGIYIPLIGINSILLRNSGIFTKNMSFFSSFKSEMYIGFGLTVSMILIGTVRELIGNGTLWGISLFGHNFTPVLIAMAPSGALITTGFILAFINLLLKIKTYFKKEETK